MRLRPTLLVAGKEILSTLRDRRAILSNLLIPFLLLPVFMLGLPLLLGGLFERESSQESEVGVQGLEAMPDELRQAFAARNIGLVAVSDVQAAVAAGRFSAGVELPGAFAEGVGRGDARIDLFYKAGDLRSDLLSGRIEGAVNDYRDLLVGERLRAVGLGPEVLEPVTLRTVDASSPAERASGGLSWLIPFFIMIWTLTGGQMTAIDATAGEKERGTLEVLLVTPIRRVEVVIGKFLATLLFGLSAAVMAILGLLVSGLVFSLLFLERLGGGANFAAVMGGSLALSGVGVAALFVSSLILAALVAALLIAITLFARSYKEAQSYLAPLSFILVLPVVGLQFADFLELGTGFYAVPALGTLLLMDEIVSGTAALTPLALAWGSSLVTTFLLLAFALLNFRREGVLFRT